MELTLVELVAFSRFKIEFLGTGEVYTFTSPEWVTKGFSGFSLCYSPTITEELFAHTNSHLLQCVWGILYL